MKTPIYIPTILIGGPADGKEVDLDQTAASCDIAGPGLTVIRYLRHEFSTPAQPEKCQAIFAWSGMPEGEIVKRARELLHL